MSYLDSMSRLSSLRGVSGYDRMHAGTGGGGGRGLKNQNFATTNYLDLPVFTLHALSQFFI